MRTSIKLHHSNVARPIEQFKFAPGDLVQLDQLKFEHIIWQTFDKESESEVARITCKVLCFIVTRHRIVIKQSGSNWYFVTAGQHSGWINECFLDKSVIV